MCYAKPGPRCSGHLEPELRKLKQYILALEGQVAGAEDQVSLMESRRFNPDTGEIEGLDEALEELDDAKRRLAAQREKLARMQFEYDGTRKGQELLNSAHGSSNTKNLSDHDRWHYAIAARMYYDDRKQLAKVAAELAEPGSEANSEAHRSNSEEGRRLNKAVAYAKEEQAKLENAITALRAAQENYADDSLEVNAALNRYNTRSAAFTDAMTRARAAAAEYIASPSGEQELMLRINKKAQGVLNPGNSGEQSVDNFQPDDIANELKTHAAATRALRYTRPDDYYTFPKADGNLS